ncbi:MAG: penicillin-binding protein [Thermicanus sp.]|nr:penicillin-binding protein [Thermicanus sp.]
MEEQKQLEERRFIRRFNIIFLITFFLFVILVLRLAYMQLVEGEKYVRASEQLSIRTLSTPAPRGWIYDANGEVLVNNKPVYTITFLDENLKKDEILAVAERLEKILLPLNPAYNRVYLLEKMDSGYVYEPKKEFADKVKKEQENGTFTFRPEEWEVKSYTPNMPRYLPRSIVSDIPKEIMFTIEENRVDLPGVNVIVDSMRQYKKGAFATYILGYMRQIPSNLADEYLAKGYSLNEQVGYAGVEKSYESVLRGTNGLQEVRVNNVAKTLETKEVVAQKPGNNLVLTIDAKYQQKVEQILAEEVKNLQTRKVNPLPQVNSAIAVVMDPKTGAVKALTNYPQYDPNIYNSPDFGKLYKTQVFGREQNKAIAGYFAPGSTIKMLSVMIGLQEGLVTPNEKILSTGSYKVGNLIKRDYKPGGFGWVDARQALQKSVNTYMYELAMRLARYPQSKTLYKQKFEVIDHYHGEFGLGRLTGIDLPGENIAWRAETEELGRLADAMIGQYDNYTPIQLVQYVSTIANGGYRMRPYVVQEIREPDDNLDGPGKLLWRKEPEVLNQVDIKPEWIKLVQEGMRMVAEPGGTAYSTFAGLPIQVAAKTGTVQRTGNNTNGLMVGYAPYEDPQMAFVVVVPGGAGGSDSAGPIARRLVESYFGLDRPASGSTGPTAAENPAGGKKTP